MAERERAVLEREERATRTLAAAEEANAAARAAAERQARDAAAAAADRATARAERAAAEEVKGSFTVSIARDVDAQTDEDAVAGLFDVPCPMCHGRGEASFDDRCCTMCNGSGVAP